MSWKCSTSAEMKNAIRLLMNENKNANKEKKVSLKTQQAPF